MPARPVPRASDSAQDLHAPDLPARSSGGSLLLTALGTAAVAAVFLAFAIRQRPHPGLDMTVYWRAAQVLHGLNPDAHELYAPSLVQAGPLDLPFTYPPLAALLYWPMGALDLDTAWRITQVTGGLGIVAVIVAALATAPLTRPWFGRRPLPSVLAVGAGCALAWHLFPTRFTFAFGQINMLLVLLVLLDLAHPGRERRGAGLLTGLAAGLKVTPAALGVVPLAQGRWRTIAGMAAGLALTVAVSAVLLPHEVVQYFTRELFSTGRVGDAARISNQSLRGALSMWGVPEGLVTPLWGLGVLVVIALTILGIRRISRHGDQYGAVMLGALCMLLISPISWEHHWAWVLPLLLALPPRDPRRAGAGQWMTMTALLVALLLAFQTSPAVLGGWLTGDPAAGPVPHGPRPLEMAATLPILTGIACGAWIALRPQPRGTAGPAPDDDGTPAEPRDPQTAESAGSR